MSKDWEKLEKKAKRRSKVFVVLATVLMLFMIGYALCMLLLFAVSLIIPIIKFSFLTALGFAILATAFLCLTNIDVFKDKLKAIDERVEAKIKHTQEEAMMDLCEGIIDDYNNRKEEE